MVAPYDVLKKLDACPVALEWVGQHPDLDMQGLWEICERPEWMFWLLRNGGYQVPDATYRKMAYEFAAVVLPLSRDKDRVTLCGVLDTVSDYIDGNASDDRMGGGKGCGKGGGKCSGMYGKVGAIVCYSQDYSGAR
jgi:hypothetical protein